MLSPQDIELLTNAVEKERKNVERGVGGRERKQVGAKHNRSTRHHRTRQSGTALVPAILTNLA